MKITGKAYRELDKQIKEFIQQLEVDRLPLHLSSISFDDDVKSIGTRFIWDVYYATMFRNNFSWRDIAEVEGVKMSHIQTALKRIVPKYYPPIESYLKEVK